MTSPEDRTPLDKFPEFIGDDWQTWQLFRDTYGDEAYKWRRLYEAVVKDRESVNEFAEERGWELPDAGPGAS